MGGGVVTGAEIAAEALERARSGNSVNNEVRTIEAFSARGLDPASILPRVNVFTYHAWRANGRQVRRGEKGVPLPTLVRFDTSKRCPGQPECRACREGVPDQCHFKGRGRMKTAYVFHISQTDPIG